MSYYSNGDEFEVRIDKDHPDILCHSKSGNDYELWLDGNGRLCCSCKGFSFQGSCRHVNEVIEQGLDCKLSRILPVMNQDEGDRDRFCRHCGLAYDDDDNFCGRCGKKRA